MFDPTSPVPGALVVRAWSTEAGVAVEWPKAVPRPARALSFAVEQFCRGLAAGGDPRGAVEPDPPPDHPHRNEMAGGPPPWARASPAPSVLLRYVELQVTDGLAALGLREPTAAERAHGAVIEPDTTPAGPMIVHAFALTPELVDDDPDQPVGPGRPWGEFRQALIDEAIRRPS